MNTDPPLRLTDRPPSSYAFSQLRRIAADQVSSITRRRCLDDATLRAAAHIVDDVRERGEQALRSYAEGLDHLSKTSPLLLTRSDLAQAFDALSREEQAVLERTAQRIKIFAEAQRHALHDLHMALPGGEAGHAIAPMERAGCYAPGGRFPLPSSVLMTAVTARAAGVPYVLVASPRPATVTLAAAYVADADGFLAAGGAHAIAALAFGAGEIPPCDVVVGPGNRWVTAAKQLVAGYVAIDMLAGPSELVVLADETADPAFIAADLLAQAEHDTDALPILVTTSSVLANRVDQEISKQLEDLPTKTVAKAALENGFTVIAANLDEAAAICDQIAPEHLEVMVRNPEELQPKLHHFGALFLGPMAAEVFGDYGAGPNHVLPTSGTARSTAGLSVLTFLRVRTWLRITDRHAVQPLTRDAAHLARLEGLEAHARAAEKRALLPLFTPDVI